MAQKKSFKTPAEMFISGAEQTAQEYQAKPAQDAEQGFTIPKGYRLAKEYKTERMQLLVRPTTKEAIKKAAAAQGVSMNDLINQLLDEYAERQDNE